MTRKTATDFDPEVLKLFDKYVHGRYPGATSSTMHRARLCAGLTGAALLDALNPKFAQAQQVDADGSRASKPEHVEIPAPGYGKVRGYLVSPAKAAGQAAGRAGRA